MSDDYASDISTTGSLILGGTSTGNIETRYDHDWFKIFLYAGQQVQFDLKGSATSSGTLTNPDFYLYNISGGWLTGDDNSGTGSNAMLTFTATATSYYYADAFANSNGKGTYTLQATPLGFNFIKTSAVAINQHTVYVANGTSGLQIKDITAPYSPSATKGYNTTGEAKDVAIVGNIIYVADGSKGLQIIDVSNPIKPARLAGYDTTGNANGVVVSTDNYAYIADGDKGLKVLDVFDPSNPAPGGNYDTTGYAYDIATSGHYAYIADGTSGLQVIDVSNPILPVLVGSYDTEGTAYSVTLNGNYAYIADGESGLQVIDISTPSNPIRVSSYDTSGAALDVTITNTTAYIADGASGIQAIDISNPIAPAFVKTLITNEGVTNIAIAGNYAYTNDSTTVQAIRIVPNILPTGNVIISGNATQGQTLTAGNTLADADGLGPITYTWQADTKVIGTGDSYKLTSSDAGKAITVTAGYTDLAYTTESITSAATSLVGGNILPTGTVNITGNAVQGQTLTAHNTLSDENGLGTVTYTWTGRTTVLGTGDTYTLTAADVGKTFFVTASYIDGAGTAEKAVSAVTSTVVVTGNHSPTGAVSITGDAVKGQVLTVDNTLADVDGLGAISYQWLANNVTINGATANSYTLTGNEIGKTVTVLASYTDGLNKLESVVSSSTAVVTEPANHLPIGEVVITGNAVKGQTLTASNSLTDDDGLGVISYQWQANGVNVGIGDSYILTGNEIGKTVIVNARYIDGVGKTESVSSAATVVIIDTINNLPVGTVSVTGNAAKGQTLTVSNTLTDIDGLGTISYQWQANGVNIGTGNSYTLTTNEIGKTITATAKYTDLLGTLESVSSVATATVVDAATAGVSIIGTDFTTSEAGNTAVFSVKLNSAPLRDVTLDFISSDLSEGVLTNPSLKFTSANWSIAQTFTVTGQNDSLVDGDIAYTINAKLTTLDVIYKKVTTGSLTLTNQDTPVANVETINGTDDTDLLQGTSAPSYVLGKAGDDDLSGGAGNDTIYGSYGSDLLFGEDDNDVLYGEQDADYLEGGAGNDTLDGGLGVDTLIGGAGNDTYYLGYDAADVIDDQGAPTDVDVVIMPYQLSKYTLPAGIEQGTIAAGTGASSLIGNTGDNALTGNDGNNMLNGAVGRDSLFGGIGNDVLVGGTGNDILSGGTGKDIFKFDSSLTANTDKVTDFVVIDDTIQLENAIFTKLKTTGVLNAGNFVNAATAADADDYVIYNPTTGGVTYDADGTGAGAGVQIALLGVNLALTHADFVVI